MRDFLDGLDFSDGWGAVAVLLAVLGILYGGFKLFRQKLKPGRDFDSQFEESLKPTNWEIDKGKGQLYLIRNLGPDAITGLRFDEDRIDCIPRQLPKNVRLEVNEAHEFMLIGTMQTGGAPPQIFVKTDQETEWRAVPVP